MNNLRCFSLWFGIVAAFLALAACQKVVVERFPTREELRQKQSQAWDGLAASMADRARMEIDGRETYRNLPVFVRTPDVTVFGQTFSHLLQSQLSKRGFRISDSPREAIDFEFQSIERRVVTAKLAYDKRIILEESQPFDTGEPELTREMADAVWERYAKRRTAFLK